MLGGEGLIREIGEHNKYVAVAGFRDVRVSDVNGLFKAVRKKVRGACVQFFDAGLIAGWEHLFFAALNALKAFETGKNISNNLAIETLLFASAQHQITKAVELLGIKHESSGIAVLVIAETQQRAAETLETLSELISGERDDGVIELTDEKFEPVKKLFGVSDLELEAKFREEGLEREALIDLVIEHMALLATQH